MRIRAIPTRQIADRTKIRDRRKHSPTATEHKVFVQYST